MEETREDQTIRLVEVLLKCGTVIKKISDALSILIGKRATLEEKMIKSYFIKLASAQAQIFQHLLAGLAAKENPIRKPILTDILYLFDQADSIIDKFLKAARYDLGYLEQYFEHQFVSELESSNLLEDSLKVFASLHEAAESADQKVSSQAETE